MRHRNNELTTEGYSVSGSSVHVHELEDVWADSADEPLALFESDDPMVQSGTYVIRPGERVPETGTTSHGGPELSIVLSGEVVLGVPTDDAEYTVSEGSLAVIPASVDHYSENRSDDPVQLIYTVLGEL